MITEGPMNSASTGNYPPISLHLDREVGTHSHLFAGHEERVRSYQLDADNARDRGELLEGQPSGTYPSTSPGYHLHPLGARYDDAYPHQAKYREVH